MGYQALLFCPDEKTARTVTQVLSELDFNVIPCTEPFAAVKKLMGERFDAVVVDCDNEQNATLLFKSARNTANNQSALAVAVVEGQAGVAKAFRIGANLVLTKPINVEQAKGTLRVARGLLRKGEAAKPATPAADTAAKPASTPAPLMPAARAAVPTVIAARPAAPVVPSLMAATASIPTPKPAPQPSIVASAPAPITEPATVEPKIETAASQPASSAGFGTSAASAPAPARESKPSVSPEDKPSTISEPESPVEKVAASGTSSVGQNSMPAPSFTFGGTVGSGSESSGGGSKKIFLAVAAVLVIAVGGYAAWTQWAHSSGTTTVPPRVTAQKVTTPAPVPHVAPSTVPASTSTSAAAAAASTPDSTTASQPADGEKISTDSNSQPEEDAESAPTHSGKVSAETKSSKPSASASEASKVPATKPAAAPIVIKNGASQPAPKHEATPDAPAPSMTGIAPADNGGTIPTLIAGQSDAPAPVLQRLNVSQGVSRGLLVKQAQPVYPANAMRMHIEGAVEILATISKDGDISTTKILSGDPQLARAAVDAVKQWKYKPYLLNGEPVEIQTQVTINFKLPN
jgi:TonB family protein